MHPVLFELGGISVKLFGVMIALGVIIASFLLSKRATRYGINSEITWDLGFWLIIFGTLGARIMYILLNLNFFLKNTSEIFTLRFEGLTSYGAIITGIPTLFFWAKKHKISLPNLLDAISVPFLIGHAIGRIGCLANGCCYGCYSHDLPWGIIFPTIDPYPHHPTQLYDSVLTLIAIIIITLLENKKKLKPTQSFFLALISYNLIRMIEEIWRQGPGGTSTTLYSSFSDAQILSASVVIISSFLFMKITRNSNP